MKHSQAALAAAALMMASVDITRRNDPPMPLRSAFKPVRIATRDRSISRYPKMVTSTDKAIAEHNLNCSTRQVRRWNARKGAA